MGSWESDVLHQAKKKWNEMFLVFVGVLPGFTGSHQIYTKKLSCNYLGVTFGDGFFHKGFCSKWPSFGFGVA